ncbi:3'(2'),5'-bisphosphate nucleotidase CysQ, partial [Pseudoalteromonas ruthenica]
MNQTELLEETLILARKAGNAIMGIYEKDFNVEYKADESKVTDADLAAHKVIVAGLKQLTPDTP